VGGGGGRKRSKATSEKCKTDSVKTVGRSEREANCKCLRSIQKDQGKVMEGRGSKVASKP